MTEIETKANALMNEVSKEHGFERLFDTQTREHGGIVYEGLCRAIEQNEALQAENVKLREALAEQVGECFCYPDCEMCFRHAQLLKETGQ